MQKEGRLYLNKDGIVACKRREEDKVMCEYNAIVLPQLYQTELLFSSHDQMGYQGIDKLYQRTLECFEWSGMKKSCEKGPNEIIEGDEETLSYAKEDWKNPEQIEVPMNIEQDKTK